MDDPKAGHLHDHHYREDPHRVGLHSGTEGDDQDHHEKKSVLKKVKDKAKKIKDTIKKHGHGHGHEHGQEYDEEDDEDEEMEQDIAVKGGQICESTVIKSRTIPVEELHAGQSGPTLERTTAMKENSCDPKDRIDASFPSQDTGKEEKSRQYGDNIGRPTAMEDHPYAPDNSTQTFSSHPSTTRHDERSRVNLGASMGLEEDPHAPKDRPEKFDPPNYQSKVADPTGDGGEEVEINPIISYFDEMSVQDKPEQGFTTGTGIHDQFSPEQLPTQTKSTTDNSADMPSDKTYVGKVSTAAISAKNAVASKLGYGGRYKGGETHGGDDQKTGSSVNEYGKKIANTVTETLSPVYRKVEAAGSAVMSKVQGTDSEPESDRAPDKGVSVKAYLSEKLKPGDEDRALSEVISYAFHKRKEEPENEVKSEPTGKVTESEEVARRLGTGNKPAGEGPDSGDVEFDSSSSVSSGSSVVDRIRGAVSSWFGKGGDYDSHTPSEPIGGVLAGSGNGGERQ